MLSSVPFQAYTGVLVDRIQTCGRVSTWGGAAFIHICKHQSKYWFYTSSAIQMSMVIQVLLVLHIWLVKNESKLSEISNDIEAMSEILCFYVIDCSDIVVLILINIYLIL